ncbi:methionine/alanine import family NSS transporter small subunit [Acinetobacter larvae]|nr:methionine/alanine import family NSS transporter small subunit [Acinetobacter larvae]
MTFEAIIMFIISAVFLWGGLILATIHLIRHPEPADDE